jgi:mRNA-degrading endonuclease toxin of MazEF toxin-antitoxin module
MPSSNPGFPRRGEIYLASLDKDRPVLILSVDSLNRHALDVCIVPITSVQRSQFSMRVPLAKGEGGLNQNCWAKCDQVTTLEKTFLHAKPFGTLPSGKLQQIENQVKLALGLIT